jgi:UDP-N-acetylmuramoyl-tripeptide--D-alanyl-D-alanine ligase
MGMRMRGEILTLTRIAEPDIAIITNIGVSHIERLGSRHEILLAKLEICEGLTGDKVLLINGNDRLLTDYIMSAQNQPGSADRKWKTLGVTSLTSSESGEDDLRFADLSVEVTKCCCLGSGTTFSVSYRAGTESGTSDLGEFFVPCVGEHHVKNALFSICCAMYFGIDAADVKKRLLSYVPTGSRGRMIQTESYLIYDDAYNASPESMAAAFESVRMIAGKRRKIAAIGGILELGIYAPEQHYQVGVNAAQSGMDLIFVCGENREDVKAGAQFVCPELPVRIYKTRDELTAALLDELLPGDAILVKASHAFEMGKVAEAIVSSENSASASSRKEDRT